MTLKIL